MSSVTRLPSRLASLRILVPKRRTSAGSSAASSTASANSPIAPTGVFSSWLTLATKSRRVASSRTASDVSPASTIV